MWVTPHPCGFICFIKHWRRWRRWRRCAVAWVRGSCLHGFPAPAKFGWAWRLSMLTAGRWPPRNERPGQQSLHWRRRTSCSVFVSKDKKKSQFAIFWWIPDFVVVWFCQKELPLENHNYSLRKEDNKKNILYLFPNAQLGQSTKNVFKIKKQESHHHPRYLPYFPGSQRLQRATTDPAAGHGGRQKFDMALEPLPAPHRLRSQ